MIIHFLSLLEIQPGIEVSVELRLFLDINKLLNMIIINSSFASGSEPQYALFACSLTTNNIHFSTVVILGKFKRRKGLQENISNMCRFNEQEIDNAV